MARPLLTAALAALLFPALPLAAGDPPAPKPDDRPKPAAPKPEEKAPAKPPEPAKPADAKAPAAKAPAPVRPAEAPLVAAHRPRNLDEALRILDERNLDVDFADRKVREVVEHLTIVTGVNVILGPDLVKDGEPDLRVTFRLRSISARKVLELTAEQHRLGIAFSRGIVLLTTKREARGKPVLRIFSVADLATPIRDFPAPDLMLHPAGAEVPKEEETERKGPYSDPDEIVTLVKEMTGEGTWTEEGISISVLKEWIVVKQYPDVQKEIGLLLAMLRAHR